MQQQAGYILDSVSDLFKNKAYEKNIKNLTRYLSYFEIKTNINHDQNRNDIDPIIAVANNIISRGLPTKPSIFIEQSFRNAFELTEKIIDEVGSISFLYKNHQPEFETLLLRAFHIIDPRINSRTQYEEFESLEQLDSQYEKRFLFNIIPEYLGEHFVQLVEPQRNFESILRFATDVQEGFERYLTGAIDSFYNQNVDFAIELPYFINGKKGLIIEIDGSQHQEPAQMNMDKMRDDAAIKANWRTVRIKTTDFKNIAQVITPIKQFVDDEYFTLLVPPRKTKNTHLFTVYQ